MTSGGLNTKQKTWIRGEMSKYPGPLRKQLGGSPPKVEEIKSWRNPAKGMAETPTAVVERRRRWQERAGRVRVGTARRQPSLPPFYTWPTLQLDYPARGRIIRAPRIFRPGGRIFRPGKPRTDQLKIFKNRCCFDEKFELMCID
jgi:hypothetical protein